jgi:hypothetical protein
MSGGDETSSTELDPQEAFGLFSHELRLEILLALWEAPGYSLRFSELQETVDERDSGKFSYHLSKLEYQFVRKIDDQYVLQYAGHRVIDAVRSGVFHESPTVESTAVDGSCPDCGAQPQFAYDDHIATVSCPECDTKLIEYPFDPGGFQDRTLQEAVRAFDRRTKSKWSLASGGTCFVCAGRVNTSFSGSSPGFEHMDRYDEYFAEDHPAVIDLSCRNCSFYSYVPAGVRLLDHPAVVGRLDQSGIDVRTRPLWSLPFITDADCVSVVSTDPWEVRIETETAGGTLEVRLDETVTVQSVSIAV